MASDFDASGRDGYFTEENSADVVTARNRNTTDERLRTVVDAAVRHLHAFVKEVEPSNAEWRTAIDFLTATGHITNDWRQEWILLSDILGVSMQVDAIDNRKPRGATQTTVLGPFHVSNAPRYESGADICLDGKGEKLLVTGRVVDTEGRPIVGATLDVWQANDEGFYDVQQQGIQPDVNLRGVFATDADGRFWFRSVKPRFYPIPAGRTGRPTAARPRAAPLPAGAHPLHRRGAGVRSRHHAPLRAGLPVPAHRRGVRGQGRADRRDRDGGRRAARGGAGLPEPVPRARLDLRPGAPGRGGRDGDVTARNGRFGHVHFGQMKD
jgi:protocatechuate 3,4-dioxygenase beta subunit